jgi:D-aminoacyl-tRNA deacylase
MKLIIQNVDSASVIVSSEEWIVKKKEEIWKWVLIYFWVSKKTTDLDINDAASRINKFVEKFGRMRRLKSIDGRLEATLSDINWEILVVSNFTLYAGNKKWTKMDFSASGEYGKAEKIYNYFVDKLKENFVVKTWEFGGMMKVESVNDGPVNYVMEI